MQDIMDTLPIDKNWMTHVEPDIAKEIALLKGWRKSDNNMRTAIRNADMKRWVKFSAKKAFCLQVFLAHPTTTYRIDYALP